jgi:ribonuclease HI
MQTTTPATTIYPKPRALKPVRNVLTGLAHATIANDTAYWCLVIRNNGVESIHSGSVDRTQNSDEQLKSAATLVALEHAVEVAGDDHVSLYINDQTIRAAVAALSLDNITLEARIQDGDIEKAVSHTAKMAGTTIAAVTPINSRTLTWAQRDALRARNAQSNAPVHVSSDASMGRRTKEAGMGFVIDWPEKTPVCVAATAKVQNILTAELLAIELAVKEILKTVHSRRLVRFNSDSQYAIDGITAVQNGATPVRMSSSQIAIVERIVHASKHYNFTFSWVKGHNGDVLNETADSLAKTARRCKEMGIPVDVRQGILERIKDSVHLPIAIAS